MYNNNNNEGSLRAVNRQEINTQKIPKRSMSLASIIALKRTWRGGFFNVLYQT